jgi:CRISPR type IV-associated protein Csf2
LGSLTNIKIKRRKISMGKVNFRLEGIATALTPIFHATGGKKGVKENTLDEIIKWKIVSPDGLSVSEVPVVNGNAFRGILRDCGASLIAETIGGFKHLDDFRLYFLGGTSKTIDKGGIEPGDIAQEKAFREKNPFMSLFGGQVKSIISGHLRVGAFIPLTTTTKHLVPSYFAQSGIGFLNNDDIVNKCILTRRDDVLNPEYNVFLMDEALIEKDEKLKKLIDIRGLKTKSNDTGNMDDEEKESKKSAQMIRRFESIAAGAKLYHSIEVFNASEEEAGLLIESLRRFSYSPYVGGRSSTDYGRLSVEYNLIQGDKKHDGAVSIDFDKGFRVENDFLQECSEKFMIWLNGTNRDAASIFAGR